MSHSLRASRLPGPGLMGTAGVIRLGKWSGEGHRHVHHPPYFRLNKVSMVFQ